MLWKIYFWIVAAMTLLAAIWSITEWSTVDSISLPFFVTALVGAYGYIYKKKVLNKYFWQYAAPLTAIYWYFYIFYLDPKYGFSPATTVGGFIFEVAITLPAFTAACLYAYSNKVFTAK